MLFAKAGSKKTAGKSHMEELLSLFEALTEKRLVPTSDTLGLKQIFQLADKGLADPVTFLQEIACDKELQFSDTSII